MLIRKETFQSLYSEPQRAAISHTKSHLGEFLSSLKEKKKTHHFLSQENTHMLTKTYLSQ